MKTVVMKFGGASLENLTHFPLIADLIVQKSSSSMINNVVPIFATPVFIQILKNLLTRRESRLNEGGFQLNGNSVKEVMKDCR